MLCRTKTQTVQLIQSDSFWFQSESHPVASRLVGKNLWMVVSRSNRKIVMLYKLDGTDFAGWSYKAMPEECYPEEVDCPLAIIAQADPAACESSAQWRSEVAAFHSSSYSKRTDSYLHEIQPTSEFPRIGEKVAADESL